ncbi:disulfide bond formation protein B [Methylobacterium haplocladii]|uniref:Disulfide bond formation protein B n=1 Tax=Methylobacterium haplocladii TaxID=1176176 RepID=A0A512IT89_9HYPH|nr:disulfide bond formation protein B [Methylobacterium haplocladii]GEP00934.1 disulfide bond formation protein B [Methylobacterium haplocladii]GJD84890.1 Disulfide bond formation protein B [Methylobacterium haplocladii]GLS59845.1 disulfide bond formation protein B [Methylobacterium haplocladii]
MRLGSLRQLRIAALVVLLGAASTVGGALFFEHVLGYVPCKLCLTERVPYYLTILLAPLAVVMPGRGARLVLGLIALVLLYGAGLGAYHAGAEWGFWPGPNDCGGGSGAGPADVGDFLKDLAVKQTVDCTKAAWRLLGVSLAGWNALIALVVGVFAGMAALRSR